MTLAPGGVPWLLRWELRLRLRSFGLGRFGWKAVALYVGFVALLHGVAVLVLHGVSRARHVHTLLTVMSAYLLFLMFVTGVVGLMRLLMAGPELTLQLTSPVPFARVLWARLLVFAALIWSVCLLLLVPVADAGALLGHPRFLLAYPVSMALAGIVAAVLTVVGAMSVRLFGVARTRRLVMVGTAVLPLLFLLPAIFDHLDKQWLVHSRPLLMPLLSPLGLVASALMGNAVALAALIAVAVLLLALAHRFSLAPLRDSILTPDAAPRAVRRHRRGVHRFRSNPLLLLFLKEWRTILREPRIAIFLLQQPLMAVFYFFLILNSGHLSPAFAATMTWIAGLLASYVSGLMISAEEAPALLGAAPIGRDRLIAYKCAAALLPVWALALVAAVWLGAAISAWAGIAGLLCAVGCSFCACATEVARPYPVSRRSFVQLSRGRRRRNPVDALSILVIVLGWTAAAWFLAQRDWWGTGIVFGVILVPFFQWWRDVNREEILGY